MFLFLLILLFIQCICFSLDENAFYQMVLRLSYLAVFYQMYFCFIRRWFFIRRSYFSSDVASFFYQIFFHQM